MDISESMRTSFTLDLSGLNRAEKLMIMTSCNNVYDESMVHRALIRQHGQSHVRESDHQDRQHKGGGRWGRPHAHFANDEPWYFDGPDAQADDEYAHFGHEEDPDGYFDEYQENDQYEYAEDEPEGIALNALISLEAEERTDFEDIALVAQSELLAYMAWGKGKGKGKVKGKGKKGK